MQSLKNNWLFMIVVVVIAGFLIVITSLSNAPSSQEQNMIPDELQQGKLNLSEQVEGADTNSKEDKPIPIIYVDVKGEVKAPGVYQVHDGERVRDLIELAGGFTDTADETTVNLAQKVMDEMVIYVRKQGETMPILESGKQVGSTKVRINYATKEEIASLSGIGEVKASAILQYREENGYFQTVDELQQVSGIGEKTLENIREKIQIP